MKRRLLTPDDAGHYRWLLQLDSTFQPPTLPRGFDYEGQLDQILEMIWSPRMTDVIGIDLDCFRRAAKVSVAQQKRDLLDVAMTFGPLPLSRTFLAAMDVLLQAENTGHSPAGLRPPALRALPVRLEAFGGIEVWCGSAAAVRSDVALVLADIDLSFRRLQQNTEASIRAHSTAGPRLRTDCRLIKHFFEAEFLPGSVALTRGYFSASRYVVHAIPPRTDDGIWKHSLVELNRCYASLWEFAERLKATRIAVQLISLGKSPALEARALEALLDQANRFRATQANPPTICLIGPTAAIGVKLTAALRDHRLLDRRREAGGFLPAGSPGERFSPGTLGTRNAVALTDKALARRSSISTVGFSNPRSSRLT